MSLVNAVKNGNVNTVKKLLNNGANVNQEDNEFGLAPLYLASWKGHAEVVKLLLGAPGIDVNKADNEYGMTPLLFASEKGHTEVVKVLLAAPGIDVNKADSVGETPLHVASREGHTGVVKMLLDKGADPFKKNPGGQTALDVARTEAVKKLLRKVMGLTTRWRNMNNEQRRGMKPILLKRMIAKGFKNGKNATFTEPIIYANYSYRTLKPVNNKNKNITSFGLVIDDKNNVKAILDLEGARRAMRNVRERANRENKTVEQPLPGIIFKNWSLVNFTPNEYFNAMKDLQKLSAIRKGKRTRNNLKSGSMNRIEANQRKTAEIANLRSTIRKASRRLNNLM
jgi:ankyrin repeat protein